MAAKKRTKAPKKRAKRTTKRKPRPDKGGRPTVFGDRLSKRIVASLRRGNFRKTAAAANGISEKTLARWVKRGHAAEALEDEDKAVPDPELPFLKFCGQVEEAEAEAVQNLTTTIAAASVDRVHTIKRTGRMQLVRMGDWRAAAWILEHGSNKKDWGYKQTLEHTGPDGAQAFGVVMMPPMDPSGESRPND